MMRGTRPTQAAQRTSRLEGGGDVTDLRALSCLRHLWTPEAPRVLPLVDLLLEVSPLFRPSSS